MRHELIVKGEDTFKPVLSGKMTWTNANIEQGTLNIEHRSIMQKCKTVESNAGILQLPMYCTSIFLVRYSHSTPSMFKTILSILACSSVAKTVTKHCHL
jgi:hypothetical protein